MKFFHWKKACDRFGSWEEASQTGKKVMKRERWKESVEEAH
jgi:hypothetical protein